MRKTLLFVFAVAIAGMVFGQQNVNFRDGLKECKAPNRNFPDITLKAPAPNSAEVTAPVTYKNGNSSVVFRELGQAANGFGFLGQRQFIWANDEINAVSFIHRMEVPPNGPGSGYLAYDYSIDGGETWSVNNQIYDPSLGTSIDARYPQHGFYNPEGNTDPTNAYLGYFAATLDGTNGGTWGGYGFGAQQFSAALNPTQHNLETEGEFLQGVPSAYTITSQGLAVCADPAKVDSYLSYTDNMIVTRGYFNPETGDFDMERFIADMPAGGVSPISGAEANVADAKVAFSPDGEIGYIAYLSDNGENTIESEGCYYPILYKTTDGGEFWEGPYNVQLGGVDGIPAVLNYLTDELIESIFEPPVPERIDIPFSTAFDMGLSVDFNGNPHLIFNVAVGSQEYSVYTSPTPDDPCSGMVAMMHVYSPNGGEDWMGDTLRLINTFRGEFDYTGMTDPVSEDNRPYIGSTMDGTKMFFSWIETTVPGNPDNDQPDIYCVGYDVINNTYSDTYVVTEFTQAWFGAWNGSMSKYVLDNGNGSYTIPFVYQQIDPLDFAAPVQFWYIDDFTLTDADLGVIQDVEELNALRFTVSDNYPNPAREVAYMDVTTNEKSTIRYDITNLTGQTVWTGQALEATAGKHQLRFDTGGLNTGIYMCNVRIGDRTISKKLIVE